MPDIKKHQAESELFEKKWFDYRFLTPDEATAVLIGAFSKTQTTYDETTRYVNIAKGLNLLNPSAWSGWKWFEKIRVFADTHCLQYNLLLEHAFEARCRLGFPNNFVQVISHNKVLDAALESIFENSASIIRESNWKIFRAENYRGHKIQNEYYEYLLSEVLCRYGKTKSTDVLRSMISEGKMHRDFLLSKVKK